MSALVISAQASPWSISGLNRIVLLNICIDGENIGFVEEGSYAEFEIYPGEHTLTVTKSRGGSRNFYKFSIFENEEKRLVIAPNIRNMFLFACCFFAFFVTTVYFMQNYRVDRSPVIMIIMPFFSIIYICICILLAPKFVLIKEIK